MDREQIDRYNDDPAEAGEGRATKKERKKERATRKEKSGKKKGKSDKKKKEMPWLNPGQGEFNERLRVSTRKRGR